jgi:hypothetical protein
MNVQSVVQLADDIIFANTGKHLDDLQRAILYGSLSRQKYVEIAQACNCTESHVKKVASELWKMLSEVLGQDLNKFNLRSHLEKCLVTNISNFGDRFQIGNINFCRDSLSLTKVSEEDTSSPQSDCKTEQSKPRLFLELDKFHDSELLSNRDAELSNLKKWILGDAARLITIFGLSGIGKTSLALQLVRQIQEDFDCVIWKSLNPAISLETLHAEFMRDIDQPQNFVANSIVDSFQKQRCLLILDDVQEIFSSGQIAGHYQAGLENYGQFFKQVAESNHKSCLILLSWDKPREVAYLESQHGSVRTLQLNGLGLAAKSILEAQRLAEEDRWKELIDVYQGNPLWLTIVSNLIQDLFDGSIADFLSYQSFLISDLELLLNQQFSRLSDLEKQALAWLSIQRDPVSISQPPSDLDVSGLDFINVMQSLRRRCFIEKVQQGQKNLFVLQPILKTYVLQNQFNARESIQTTAPSSFSAISTQE